MEKGEVRDTFTRLFELPKFGGDEERALVIHQQSVGDVGCVVWDAAISLSQLLAFSSEFSTLNWKSKTVLELGAGTGLVGLVAAALGANVCITDLPECVPLMTYNCQVNASCLKGPCIASTLAWGETTTRFHRGQFDLILMADLIYYEASLRPLVNTLDNLCAENTGVLMSFEQRFTGDKVELTRKFFQMLSAGFVVEELPIELLPENYRCPDIHIFAIGRKTSEHAEKTTQS